MPAEATALGAHERSDTLLILVHGRMDTAKSFDEAGLIQDLRDRGSTADIVSLGAAPDLFRRRIFADSVEQQVVAPARAQGYERVFIAGVSRDGMGVLTYARKYPNSVDGVLVIAPFLGPRALVEDIERQGPTSWNLEAASPSVKSMMAGWAPARDLPEMWAWLYQLDSEPHPPLHMAWGTTDGFAPTVEKVAARMPASHSYATEGEHDWETWRRLWGMFLDDDPYGLLAA